MSTPTPTETQTLIRSISMGMRDALDRRLAEYDLSFQQGWIVGFIHEREQAGVNVRQVDVEADFGLTGSSITSLLQGLERKGYIVRRVSPSDNRAKELFLTDKGRGLVDEFDQAFLDLEARLTKGFSPEEQAFFVALLRRVMNNLK